MDLGRLLHPRSVAVVGATERPAAYGSEALLNLRRLGFPGRVYAVNPARAAVHGIPAHPRLADLPEAPDAVVVAVPAGRAVDVVEEAGALGCGGAVVFAAGFAEGRDAAGAGEQAALAAAARRHGLPVCGPNGNGIVALRARAALWGDALGPLEAGGVALVTQSGNAGVNALATRRGLRLHTVVSCGNAAVLGPEDYVAALARAGGVRAIALYLEDAGDGASWCDAFAACAAEGIGVAVLKAGTSAAGAAAARARTGAVAGDVRAFRAFAEECGAAWAEDVHELLEVAKALAAAGRRRGGAAGTAVMTCSGGDASVAADLAGGLGVRLAPLVPATREALAAGLPAAAAPQNPLDFTSLLWEDPAAIEALALALARDPGVGRVLVLHDEPPGLDADAAASWAGVRGAVRAAAARSPVPVLVAATLPELLDDAHAAALQEAGIPALAGLRAGLRAAAALAAAAPAPGRIAALAGAIAAARAAGATGAGAGAGLEWPPEHAAKARLAAAGVPVPAGAVAEDSDGAAAAAAALAGPVAVKLSGPALRHKTELGALRLGLAGPAEVRAAAAELLALPAAAGAVLLVEAMAPPGVELLVSARADAVAPVLTVGLGGVWTERLGDVALVPLPASPARVERALRGLRGAGALLAARGGAVPDLAAAARLAAAAGDLLLEAGLVLLELNPVMVHPDGATAADALLCVPVPAPHPASVPLAVPIATGGAE